MGVTSLWRLVQGYIIKNSLRVFVRGENLLQNGMLHFAFKLSQSSEIVFQKSEFKQTKNGLKGAIGT